MAVEGVRREKAALSSGCKSHPANCSSRKQPEQLWRKRNGWSLRVKRVTNWWQRECAGRNVSEHWANLEKDDAQTDPTTLSGKADTAGRKSKAGRPDAVPG